MRPLVISGQAAVQTLQQEIQRSEESRYDHRLHAVLLVAHGTTCPEAAALLGDAPRSVEYWVHRFQAKGLAGRTPWAASAFGRKADGDHPSRPAWETERSGNARESMGWQNSLRMDRERIWHPPGRATVLATVPSIGLSATQATAGFWAKADPGRQKRHKKLQRYRKDEAVDLWALDEVHFQQQGSRCRMWIPPEDQDPVVFP